MKIRVIWFDPAVNSSSNKAIQREIKRKYGEVLDTFSKAKDAVYSFENYWIVSIVICSGSEGQGEELIAKVHDLEHVAKIPKTAEIDKEV